MNDQTASFGSARAEDTLLNSVQSHDTDQNVPPTPAKEIAPKENKAVLLLRRGLCFSLVASALAVSLSAYLIAREAQVQDFESAVLDAGHKVIESFQAVAVQRLGNIASAATTITTEALAANSTWPFVRIRYFEARAEHWRSLAGVQTLAFSCFVDHKDREQWEEFVVQNMDWWNESVAYIQTSTHSNPTPTGHVRKLSEEEPLVNVTMEGMPPGMPDYSQGYSPQILAFGGPFGLQVAPPQERYMPWWHQSPVNGQPPVFVNINLADDPGFRHGDLMEILDGQEAALGQMTIEEHDVIAKGIPTSGFYYPVLESLERGSKVVASIGTLLHWDRFLRDILPENINGLVAVIENTCEQKHTFEINGRDVEYMGEGDLHDTSFDYLKEEASFTELIDAKSADGSYLGFPMQQHTGCQYKLTVYPSQELKDEFVNSWPVILALCAAAIFLFTSLVFLGYDRMVEHRQKLVATEAQRSGAIVDSLFPEAYRARLMQANEKEEEKENSPKKKKAPLSVEAKLAQLAQVMKGEVDAQSLPSGDEDDEPIADLYDNCTVFFADIAGFTKWSASRQACDVFRLLQTVYSVMDEIAEKRGVFKVETIGDSYMAVTGLPAPQEKHAIIMAKFAYECMYKVRVAFGNLAEKLGEDTDTLALRMGLHSGPVTAGILRGAKARFQLFGDSVNTASRMESTGMRNRIQLSSTTADAIMQDRRNTLAVQPREDLVEAKGKGTMQTYWLLPNTEVDPSRAATLGSTGRKSSFTDLATMDSSSSDSDC